MRVLLRWTALAVFVIPAFVVAQDANYSIKVADSSPNTTLAANDVTITNQ